MKKANLKKKWAPPPALDMQATAAKLYEDVQAAAEKSGLEVVMLVSASNGDWRALWGKMPLDRAAYYVFRLLTHLQRALP